MGVAILDCGAQYAKVIDRRVRELEVESDILPVNTPASGLEAYDAFIITGGPASVNTPGAPKADPELFSLGKPILGICYGMQLMTEHFGGNVAQLDTKEYAETNVVLKESALFQEMDSRQQVLMSHWDSVIGLPEGFTSTASSDGIVAAIENPDKQLYAVQFHPEVDLTPNGTQIFKNFLFGICNLERTHTIDTGISTAVEKIKEQVGKANVALLISGGVDSAVTAALLVQALPAEQVFAIHIDNGLMRKDESAHVMQELKKLGLQLRLVNAQARFLDPLQGVVDPEEKRHIIGDMFIKVAKEEITKIPGTVFLAQGTLRPDLIESASELVSLTADTIKTHHNDSPLVREWRKEGKVVEPNVDWHKDEVRQVARKLGLPESISARHPFPGPGLGVRVLCSDGTPAAGEDTGITEVAARYGFEGSLLPVLSVGVQGDERSYRHPAVLSGEFSWEKLKEASIAMPKEVHTINRVCYLLSGTPGTVQRMTLTEDVLTLLRDADEIVNELFDKHGVTEKLAQAPVVLLPNRTLVLRPFVTNDFMTGRAAVIGEEISLECLQEISERVTELDGIEAVLYDLTSKPPGTTEWE